MPLNDYGVLKGRPVKRRLATEFDNHYELDVMDGRSQYLVLVNVQSQIKPSDLEYCIDENFRHPIVKKLPRLFPGFNRLPRKSDGLAIDYIRSQVLNPACFEPLPYYQPGPDNDLNEKLDCYVQRALSSDRAIVYVFGEPFRRPSRNGFSRVGLHNVHMNQGNGDRFSDDNGTWQDGALIIHYPEEQRWIAVFLKFQGQAWQTQEGTGHAIKAIH